MVYTAWADQDPLLCQSKYAGIKITCCMANSDVHKLLHMPEPMAEGCCASGRYFGALGIRGCHLGEMTLSLLVWELDP